MGKTQSTREPKTQWKKIDLDDGGMFECSDIASTCCGVLEIGAIESKKIEFTIESVARTKVENLWWSPGMYYGAQYSEGPAYTRLATLLELTRAFKDYMKHQSRFYGMAVCYLLPEQHDGDFGKLLVADKWTLLGSFWNPKTRHTLYHWTKTLHRKSPRKKKSSKSILGRSS